MTKHIHILAVAVEAHGETLTTLELERPTAEQVGRFGLPYVALGESPDFKMAVVMKYIATLAGVPPSTVNQLDSSDLNDLAWAVLSFFLSSAAVPPKS